ncbi:hypothetical protein Pryu01_02452 [Paraliobacillus ryukyuensis]|uniref:DUF3278 domain-containing protein n=1 Tax=Paraliobacillus ryukyuensis TaxID=200904 RepID=A0A366DTZ1_9BACI|nr:hypothetical protein [Paraliobacillus ryukyuensis]RBO93561.1 hypothetical protein DES48_11172 [Paraliobacillus ryukyuensis]
MEKSWLSKFLPNDEYKERKMVYFIAESAVILALLLVVFALINNYSLYGNSTTGTITLLALFFFIAYILVRYTLSGIEYTEVTTKTKYTKERKAILTRSIVSIILIVIFSIVIQGIPANLSESADIVGPAILIGIFTFFGNYTSLRKSYNKNRNLLDE